MSEPANLLGAVNELVIKTATKMQEGNQVSNVSSVPLLASLW
uniref:Uncharacterized protein n=1 Tax=Arundo donax TaxID=35708 RepID=A0A0A9HJ22_ARUDO